MRSKTIMQTPEWRKFRDQIWERDQGKCQLCGGVGKDVHYDNIDCGLYNPKSVYVVCRCCHEAWWGYPPDHLPDDHKYKAFLKEIARRVRLLPKKFRGWYW